MKRLKAAVRLLNEAITNLSPLARIFLLVGLLWILGTLFYLALFQVGSVWLHLAFRSVMTSISVSLLLLLGGGILLDLSEKDEARKNKP